MDHSYITDHAIVERYVMGLLLPEETAQFEDHYRSCPNCLYNVEAIRDFHIGLKDEPLLDAPPSVRPVQAPPPSPGFMASIVRSGLRPLIWTALGLLLAAIPGLWAFREMRSARVEVRKSTSDYAGLRQSFEQSRAELIGLRGEVSRSAAPLATAIPVFGLAISRGAETSVNPANRVNVSKEKAPWIVLALEYTPDPAVKRYRAAIVDSAGGLVTNVDPVTPATSESLGIAIRSDALKPGNYRATLEGVTTSGRAAVIARYQFSVR